MLDGPWSEVLLDALVEIGVRSPGEALDADETADTLRRLRGMLGEWSMKGLLVPGLTIAGYDVTASGAVYTLGPAANMPAPDIAITSPVEALYALNYRPNWREKSRPLDEVSYVVLSETRSLDRYTPTCFFYDRAHPLARVLFDRKTEPGDRFEIAYRGHFGAIEAGHMISAICPVEFREPIMLNLAVKLAPSYGVKGGRAAGLSDETKKGARDGISTIRKRNLEDPETLLDPALRQLSTSQLNAARYVDY